MEFVRKPKTAVLTFLTEDGTNSTMSLSPVRSDLTKAELEACMDAIIAQNCFSVKGGDLVGKVKAQIVDVTMDVIEF